MLDVLKKKRNQSQFNVDTWNVQVSKNFSLSGDFFALTQKHFDQ